MYDLLIGIAVVLMNGPSQDKGCGARPNAEELSFPVLVSADTARIPVELARKRGKYFGSWNFLVGAF